MSFLTLSHPNYHLFLKWYLGCTVLVHNYPLDKQEAMCCKLTLTVALNCLLRGEGDLGAFESRGLLMRFDMAVWEEGPNDLDLHDNVSIEECRVAIVEFRILLVDRRMDLTGSRTLSSSGSDAIIDQISA